jgi:hypothetical protein
MPSGKEKCLTLPGTRYCTGWSRQALRNAFRQSGRQTSPVGGTVRIQASANSRPPGEELSVLAARGGWVKCGRDVLAARWWGKIMDRHWMSASCEWRAGPFACAPISH